MLQDAVLRRFPRRPWCCCVSAVASVFMGKQESVGQAKGKQGCRGVVCAYQATCSRANKGCMSVTCGRLPPIEVFALHAAHTVHHLHW